MGIIQHYHNLDFIIISQAAHTPNARNLLTPTTQRSADSGQLLMFLQDEYSKFMYFSSFEGKSSNSTLILCYFLMQQIHFLQHRYL